MLSEWVIGLSAYAVGYAGKLSRTSGENLDPSVRLAGYDQQPWSALTLGSASPGMVSLQKTGQLLWTRTACRFYLAKDSARI